MRPNNWSLWLVVGMFLAVLAFLAVVVRPAKGDDFDAKIAQLRAKMAAKKADPFAGKNAAKGQPCGCPYCTCNKDSNCGSPLCPKLNRDPQAGGHGVPGLGVPEIPGNPWQWDDALAASNGGNGWWRYGNGTSPGTSPVAQPTYYEPVQQYYYQPVRSFSGFRSFGSSGCSTGG